MKVYLHGDRAERSARYSVHVAPAGDEGFVAGGDVLKDWTYADGRPRQFEIVFKNGMAEVPDPIGRYMVERGIAHSNNIWRRIVRLFDSRGNEISGGVYHADGSPVVTDVLAAA